MAVLATPALGASTAASEQLTQQREDYRAARKALADGQVQRFKRLQRKLRDYPLYPYLEAADLTRRLRSAPESEVREFLERHPDAPYSRRLRHKWLTTLARQGRWDSLLANYRPTKSTALGCYRSRALLATQQQEQAFAQMEQLWLTGKSLPRSCDHTIAAWHRAGGLSNELVWERIRLAMQARKPQLAKHLARYLPADEQRLVTLWRKVRRNPQLVFNDPAEAEGTPAIRWIRGDAVARLARKQPAEAARKWDDLRGKYAYSPQERNRIERRLALALIRGEDTNTKYWLSHLNLLTPDVGVQDFYIVSALQDQDWETALDWMARLESDERHSERWRYWRGRALEAMGRLEEAQATYQLNADARSYYGFLAADRLGLPYRMVDRPVEYTGGQIAELNDLPAFLRARELFYAGQVVQARREWHHAMQQMSEPQLLMAAQAAHAWGWHDRAIVAFGRAGYWDDLQRRFPLAHQKLVLEQARQYDLNPAWAFAIIRQESAFTQDARSHAGAMGLMQLMPGTARQMARSLRVPMRNRLDLMNVNTNVRLGVGYLKKMQDRFGGSKVLATAAYNAGGMRVERWRPEQGSTPADVWIEAVPFHETRKYLKRVLTYTVIYEERLGRTPGSLIERMPGVRSASELQARLDGDATTLSAAPGPVQLANYEPK